MKDIYDIDKELKNISDAAQCDEIKERIDNVIKALNNIQADIFENLSSIDPYSHGDEIGQAICEVMEKVDYEVYWNEYCNATSANDNED